MRVSRVGLGAGVCVSQGLGGGQECAYAGGIWGGSVRKRRGWGSVRKSEDLGTGVCISRGVWAGVFVNQRIWGRECA